MFDFDVVTGTTIEQNALNSKVSKRYRQLQENQAQVSPAPQPPTTASGTGRTGKAP